MNQWRPESHPTVPMALAIQACARTCPLVDELLGPTGPIAQAMGSAWEDRPEQRQLANTIRRSQQQRLHALTEGQTGCGKSHAALVPSILHALETGKPVVISTRSTVLQRQYAGKDLPFLHAALTPWLEAKFGRTFTFATLFGRSRYYCEKKGSTTEQPEWLLDWLENSEDGELGSLPLDPALRRAVTADKDECPGARCTVAKEGGCWFYSARQAAKNSDLVIVNHALLLAALRAQPGTVLPIWDACVVDEAHTLEEEARQALGTSFTAGRVRQLVKKALAYCGEHRQLILGAEVVHQADCPLCPGYQSLDERFPDHLPPGCEERLREATNAPRCLCDDPPTAEGIDHELTRFLAALEHQLRDQAEGGTIPLPDLTATTAEAHLVELNEQLLRLAVDVENTGAQHWEESSERAQADTLESSLRELVRELRRLRTPEVGRVTWLQLGEKTAIHSQPVDVSEFLRETLWKAPTALSSATLATDVGEHAFRYVRDTLGVNTLHQCQVGSPFKWAEQAWLYTPEEGMLESLLGLKERNSKRRDELAREYARVSALHIREVLKHTKGRAFLLFTSRQGLRYTQEQLADMPWPYITQGEMGQQETLDWFRSTPGAVLFALSSYWEGCDVVGDALSCVIIDRIPNAPPSDLVHQARLARAGGGHSAFLQLSVPYAVTKLKQGFGRLIRTVTDRGLCVLMDPRFRTKDYGRAIIQSLPPARRITRAHLKQVPWLLASSGEPCPGPEDVAERLRQLAGAAIPDAEHAAYAKQLASKLPLLTPGLWRAGSWLCDKYSALTNVSETP